MDATILTLQSIYNSLGLSISVNEGDLYGLGSVLALLLLSLFQLLDQKESSGQEDQQTKEAKKTKTTSSQEKKTELARDPSKLIISKSEEKEVPKVSFTARLKKGFARSRSEVWGKIGTLLSGTSLDAETLEELEELLYGADIGPEAANELIQEVEKKLKDQSIKDQNFKEFLFDFLSSKMSTVQSHVDTDLYQFNPENKGQTKVIMIVGVNGAGKTTTIGKLATKLTGQGAKVVIGACDTFRAAAVDQLKVWCDRAGAQMVRAKEGSNPSGVGYEALKKALEEKADYCILDTAGRLHTKGNLMEELLKSKNVLKKLDPNAPHQTLLVIDAITGQNALRQAEEFHKVLGLDGLILTKCDGSSKAGSAVAIVQGLQVPITYIGVGESVEDLDIFHLDEYLNALLDREGPIVN